MPFFLEFPVLQLKCSVLSMPITKYISMHHFAQEKNNKFRKCPVKRFIINQEISHKMILLKHGLTLLRYQLKDLLSPFPNAQ